jgi:hypothetical protein
MSNILAEGDAFSEWYRRRDAAIREANADRPSAAVLAFVPRATDPVSGKAETKP